MKSKTGIVYIQRDKFQIYSPSLSGILEFRYVPELVKDMDVIDKELFENIVKLFIENNKIPAGSLVIFLGDTACFIKDFLGEDAEKLKAQAKEFADQAPFDSVSTKTFAISKGIRVFATNKDLYEAIQIAFEKEKFTIEAVLPGFLVGDSISTAPELTQQAAAVILRKLNTVRQYNLLHPDVEVIKDTTAPDDKTSGLALRSAPTDKKRLLLLIGVFGFLITALVIVYFINYPIKP